LIVGLSGFQLELPYQLAATLVGLMCVIDSYLREAESWLSPARFRQLLQRLAVTVGASEVVAVGPRGYEEARIRGARDGDPVEIGVQRRAGALAIAEVVVGSTPPDEPPPLSLWRRGTPRLGRK